MTEMRKHTVCALLLLVLTHTGRAGEISMSHTRDRERLTVSCRLLEEDNVIQINWVMISGTNSTNLGIFHPEFGTHINPEYAESVEIKGSASDRSSSLNLSGGAVEENSQLCCVFITFPSGNLKQCADMRIIDSTAEAHDAEALEGIRETGVEQWALLVGGSILCLVTIIITIYSCWRHCCFHRRRVFEVQTNLTESDQLTASEGITDESLQQQPPLPETPQGFNPSKLYSKIKLDLLYGRLWKTYQGRAQAWDPATQQVPQRVYFLLGEHRSTQKEEIKSECLSVPESDPESDPPVPPAEERSEVNEDSSESLI